MSADGAWGMFWGGFPIAFGLTCVIELPAYLCAFATLGWVRPSRLRDPTAPLTLVTGSALVFALNAITHPLLWASSLRWPGLGELVALEAAVVIVEGLLIFLVVRRQPGWALLSSLGANALSLLVGAWALPAIIGAV